MLRSESALRGFHRFTVKRFGFVIASLGAEVGGEVVIANPKRLQISVRATPANFAAPAGLSHTKNTASPAPMPVVSMMDLIRASSRFLAIGPDGAPSAFILM